MEIKAYNSKQLSINESAHPQEVMSEVSGEGSSSSIINRSADFWLLGGASIALWAVMICAQFFRDRYVVVGNHFLQIGAFFSLMTLFCNHPHFMISYRFGYGRGWKFIFQNWFALLAVPIALVAFYAFAYLNYTVSLNESPFIQKIGTFFAAHHLHYRWDDFNNLGTEALAMTVALMFLTVGWHYSKQIFGCMMVYAKYDHYPLTTRQRTLIKLSVFSVAWFSFINGVISMKQFATQSGQGGYFYNIPMISYSFPRWSLLLTGGCVALFSLLVVVFVFYPNYKNYGKKPGVNFLISWIAFHVWWVPLIPSNEFYILTVPFFHSLQYLPFAYRMETAQSDKNSSNYWVKFYSKIAILLFIGFAAFELVPSLLDQQFDTFANKGSWFFLISFVVFINIHHFFIDSVVWKFRDPHMGKNLLGTTPS